MGAPCGRLRGARRRVAGPGFEPSGPIAARSLTGTETADAGGTGGGGAGPRKKRGWEGRHRGRGPGEGWWQPRGDTCGEGAAVGLKIWFHRPG